MAKSFKLGLEQLKSFCDRNDVQYLENEKLGQLGIPTPLGQGIMIRIIPHTDRNMLTLALPIPIQVAPGLIQEVARATSLANSGLFMGAWVLNHAKGELYFRISLPLKGVSFDDEAMLFALNVIVGTVRGVGDAFLNIIREGAPAETIVEAMSQASVNAEDDSKSEEKEKKK